jgi:RimJ/RimL family protein N-acetyltransferase
VRLETERLVLRPLTRDDLDGMAHYLADPETMRFVGSGGPRTREQAQATLEWMIDTLEQQAFGQLAAERKDDGVLVGRSGLNVWNSADWTITRLAEAQGPVEVEIAYLFGREHWGHGYATEAASAIRDWAFANLDLERLIALIYPDNVRSIRVAEKLGMQREGEVEMSGNRLDLYASRA